MELSGSNTAFLTTFAKVLSFRTEKGPKNANMIQGYFENLALSHLQSILL